MLLSEEAASVLKEQTKYPFERGDEILDLEWYLPVQTRRSSAKPEFRFGFDRMIGHSNHDNESAVMDGVSDGVLNWDSQKDPYPIKSEYVGTELGG